MNEKNYVQYNLLGLQNLKLTENKPYKIEEDQFIDMMQLNDDLTKMILYLKPEICYSDKKSYIDMFAYKIMFNLIAQTEADIANPAFYVESIFKNGKIDLIEYVKFKESITVFRSCTADRIYSIAVSSPNALEKHCLLYQRILGI